ncbi:MAG TPA: Gfo/Idh/MocA family oxidoreductase [Chloroflexota bacterium]|nr:Gfo/Idh/MocA family oxidoreductase [Chloroflexota bacterium]
MSRLRIALVGAGRRGAGAHLPVLSRLSDVYELVAVCDRDESTARQHASALGVRAYTSVRELLERETLDAADVVVPADAHHAIAVFLMERGVNVLVETPIAPTLALADLMIQAAQRNGVKLEVAENYYRAPLERLKAMAIDAGLIGDVSRIYRIFHEGGYHGMSLLRTHARGRPVSIMGLSHTSPVVPITDRMQRHHRAERWSMAVVDFDNGVMAVQLYSNVIHARSLGRGQVGISQIDGTAGTIVNDEVHVTPPEALASGARSVPLRPERVTRAEAGVEVLEAIRLPGTEVVWENPLARYPLAERQVAVADELMSLAQAVQQDAPPAYGAAAARLDQEMNLAMLESGKADRQTIPFPLTGPTAGEEAIHARFREHYGCDAQDVDRLVDVFFPRV